MGAHFDHVSSGSGAVDNWSGASLLPSLYQSLATSTRKHTFVFVGFFGEEEGLVGSALYVHERGKEQLAHIDAMVNIDSLGLGPTNVWASHADRNLLSDAIVLSRAMKIALTGVNMEEVGSTDSETFRDKKVPTISFSSITQTTLHILHTPQDQLSQIREDDYYNTYEFLSAYLTFLDTNVPARKIAH